MLLSLVFTLPAMFVYARVLALNPEMNLAQISEKVLGRVSGKIVTALMTLYALQLGSIVVSNFYFYVGATILQETPHFFVAGLLVLVCIYMAKSGIEILGKWSHVAFFAVMVALSLTLVLSFNQYEIERLKPVGEHRFRDLIDLAFARFSFPFAELVLFLFLGSSIRKEHSPYKIYCSSCLIGITALLILVLRNLMVLGPEMVSAVYFPSYIAARVINVSTFLTRVEGTISMNYIVSGVVKISLCLFASAIGLASLLGVSDYKKIVVPAGMIIFALSITNYPVIIWIASEVRAKKEKRVAGKVDRATGKGSRATGTRA